MPETTIGQPESPDVESDEDFILRIFAQMAEPVERAQFPGVSGDLPPIAAGAIYVRSGPEDQRRCNALLVEARQVIDAVYDPKWVTPGARLGTFVAALCGFRKHVAPTADQG